MIENKQSNFLLYKGSNGNINIDVLLEHETVWLSQQQIAELFQKERSVITKHINNVFKEGELEAKSNVQLLHIAQSDKPVKFYNLDVIISVGYRVKSQQGTRFRQWATAQLKEFIIKGFVMDDERRLYQKITDIYAQCSIDYDVNSELTQTFFATTQNKLHWAIAGETAAEIIHHRVNSEKENIGLSSWRNAPVGRIRKHDVAVALAHQEYEKYQAMEDKRYIYLILIG